jgi:hypothetical protein
MMTKKKPKTVVITTIQDMVDVVTKDNYELLMKDFALMIYIYLKMKDGGVEIKGAGMEWTDDGKNEITGLVSNIDT